MDSRPIGIFDSGVGGLTVMREVMEQLPYEDIVYLGDTARIPYGSKSEQTIRKFALQCSLFLKSKNVKTIVIACNTASAVAFEHLKNNLDIPVLGVIDPGARSAANFSESGRIGVIGTTATINSNAYGLKIMEYKSDAEIIGIPCPLFVPIVEEGWEDTTIAMLSAEKYLEELLEHEVDSLVLGCTHYPVLRNTIKKVMGPKVKLINPAYETARDLKKLLQENDMLNEISRKALYEYYATDAPERLRRIGGNFLKKDMENVYQVSIDNL